MTWALILIWCAHACHPVMVPERYDSRAICEAVGKRAKEQGTAGWFYCVDLRP